MLGEERRFDENEAVFREYESADNLYVVLEGRVSTVLREQGVAARARRNTARENTSHASP